MKTFKSFSEFLFEGNSFGITYDNKASLLGKPNYKTKSAKAPIFKDIYDNKDLKLYGVLPQDYRGWEKSITKGLKVIKEFVDTEDFSKYANEKETGVNWDDKAYIYHTLTGWLGGYSQNKLSLVHLAYIGIKGKIDDKDFKVYNENRSGKFTVGSTENWPEKRPQLRFVPQHQKSWYEQDIINEFPTLVNYPKYGR